MRVVFASLGAYGHLYPMLPLALACRDAGHEVTCATGEPFLGRLPVPSVPGYPAGLTLGWVEQETARRHPEAEGMDFGLAMFGEVTAGQALPVMLDLLTHSRPDLVVFEATHVAAGVAASALGVPALTFSTALASFFTLMLHQATLGFQEEVWSSRSRVPPAGPLLTPMLIDPCPPSIGGDPGVPRVPLRTSAYAAGDADPPVWPDRPRRPRVYLTLGTVAFGATEVLERAVREVAALDVDVLVAVGPAGDPGFLAGLGDHVRVERFVNQAAVLQQVDLTVHHGGTGTVLAALAAGLPQVILPQGADQPYNAELLVRRGLAGSQVNDAYTPGSIPELVAPLLGECPERAAARRVASEIATMPAPAEVVPRLLEVAGAR